MNLIFNNELIYLNELIVMSDNVYEGNQLTDIFAK